MSRRGLNNERESYYLEKGEREMSKKDPRIIRVDDEVRIIRPEFFVRCGYSMTFEQACKEVMKKHGESIREFIESIGIITLENLDYYSNVGNVGYTQDKIVAAFAYDHLRNKGFDGKERKIYTIYNENYVRKNNGVFKVTKIKYVKTGVYRPGNYVNDYYEGYDYSPAYLSNEKTHKILQLEYDWPFVIGNDETGCIATGWIEAKNVEKIMGGEYDKNE